MTSRKMYNSYVTTKEITVFPVVNVVEEEAFSNRSERFENAFLNWQFKKVRMAVDQLSEKQYYIWKSKQAHFQLWTYKI